MLHFGLGEENKLHCTHLLRNDLMTILTHLFALLHQRLIKRRKATYVKTPRLHIVWEKFPLHVWKFQQVYSPRNRYFYSKTIGQNKIAKFNFIKWDLLRPFLNTLQDLTSKATKLLASSFQGRRRDKAEHDRSQSRERSLKTFLHSRMKADIEPWKP